MPTDLDIEREFADLVETLREDTPEIRPHFARRLDAKVAAGFPREPRWRRLFSANPMLVPGVAASALLALMVSVAMFSSTGGDDESAGGGGMSAQVASDESASSQAARPAARPRTRERDSAGSASLQASPPVAGGGSPRSDARGVRKVETSASLVLGAKPGGVQEVADQIVRVTDRHRGIVMS